MENLSNVKNKIEIHEKDIRIIVCKCINISRSDSFQVDLH